MWWIIVVAIIAGLIVLGILVLSIPFDLTFQFDFYGKAKINMKWAWLFGLLRRDVKPGQRKPKKNRARGKFDLSRTLRGIRSGSEILRIKGLVAQFIRLIKRIFGSIKIRKLAIEFHVGLDDPSETFYIFALTEPINRLLNHFQPYAISIQPSFMEPTFEGYTHGSVRIYPILLVPPLMQFIFSPPAFRLIRKMVADRWKRNRQQSKNRSLYPD